jgi:hypothetical protein
MALSLEYFDAAGSAVAAGVFIPISDLPGIEATELAAAQSTANKEAKALLALMNATATYLAVNSGLLGITLTQNNNSNAGPNLINLNYTLGWEKLADVESNAITQIPVPSAGANAGVGDFGIADVFPNAAKVAAAGAVAGAGIVVTDTALAAYGAAAPTVGAGEDNRAWFAALFDHMAEADVREIGITQSAVVTAALGSLGATIVPADFYAATDPTSDVVEADLPKLGLMTRSTAISIQVQLNQSTQKFDVVVS